VKNANEDADANYHIDTMSLLQITEGDGSFCLIMCQAKFDFQTLLKQMHGKCDLGLN